jgi:hypothetical protein
MVNHRIAAGNIVAAGTLCRRSRGVLRAGAAINVDALA